MAITYPLALPSTDTMTLKGAPRFAAAQVESPFDFTEQVQRYAGERWLFEVEVPPMKEDDAEAWIAWKLKLRGRSETFLFGDPSRRTPRGSFANAAGITVNGAHLERQRTLSLGGFDALETNAVKAGDYVQVGAGLAARLYRALDDVNSDPSGNLILDIFPGLRSDLAGGEAVTYTAPLGLFRLGSNVAEWTVTGAKIYGINFTAVEVVAT